MSQSRAIVEVFGARLTTMCSGVVLVGLDSVLSLLLSCGVRMNQPPGCSSDRPPSKSDYSHLTAPSGLTGEAIVVAVACACLLFMFRNTYAVSCCIRNIRNISCVTTCWLLIYVIRLSDARSDILLALVNCCWDVNLADDDPNGSAALTSTSSICHMASRLPLVTED
jgi:hypothetical protein